LRGKVSIKEVLGRGSKSSVVSGDKVKFVISEGDKLLDKMASFVEQFDDDCISELAHVLLQVMTNGTFL
jgi:hypothetical protein